MFEFLRKLFLPIIIVFDFITKYFKTVIFLTIIYFIVFDSKDTYTQGNISYKQANLQRIELYGPIMNVSKLLDEITKAKEDKNIKGVLFLVNSPGGSVAPSVELAYAIKELKEKKPVVVYASGTIASGSYYASIWANKIIVNPGSMVGSIGVIMQGYNAEILMEKIGVSTQTVKAGRYKESGTTSRKWFPYEKEQLQSVIDDIYNMFIRDVAKARKLNVKDHTKFADARIFTASQAKSVGLIDDVATIAFANNTLKKLAKVKVIKWKRKDRFDRFDKFLDKFIQGVISKVFIIFNNELKAY